MVHLRHLDPGAIGYDNAGWHVGHPPSCRHLSAVGGAKWVSEQASWYSVGRETPNARVAGRSGRRGRRFKSGPPDICPAQRPCDPVYPSGVCRHFRPTARGVTGHGWRTLPAPGLARCGGRPPVSSGLLPAFLPGSSRSVMAGYRHAPSHLPDATVSSRGQSAATSHSSFIPISDVLSPTSISRPNVTSSGTLTV
jgi:hypothetical protein